MARAARHRSLARQRGAVVVLFAISLMALLAMVGMVIDLGRLYIVSAELQNAADACALSAAQDLGAGAGTRARYVGNRNAVQFQQVPIEILPADVSFSDTLTGPRTPDVTASTQYAHCEPHKTNPVVVNMLFMWVAKVTDVPMSAAASARLLDGKPALAM